MEENWDLYSVVRGFMGETAAAADTMGFEGDGFSFPSTPPSLDAGAGADDFHFYFPDLQATQTALQELEELCKPFLPPQQQHQESPSSSAATAFGGRSVGGHLPPPTPPSTQQQPRQQSQPRALSTPRSKRRKNQQKRVVCQVPADGVSSDVWAWRKYGQKPIKGSPFPRGYYRCSSSKGCVARKQVERSRTDPGTFVITYTGEHNHPVPTHRNSLAGSTRHKFPTSKTQQVNATDADPAITKASSSSSPASTGLSSMEDEQRGHVSLREPKEEGGEEEEEARAVEGEEEEDEGMLLVSDMLRDDDMQFIGFEELQGPPTPTAAFTDGGLLPDCQFSAAFSSSSPWVANNTAAAAGGSC